jgi:hypothetical protein
MDSRPLSRSELSKLNQIVRGDFQKESYNELMAWYINVYQPQFAHLKPQNRPYLTFSNDPSLIGTKYYDTKNKKSVFIPARLDNP